MKDKDKLLDEVKKICKSEFLEMMYTLLIEPLDLLDITDDNIVLVSPAEAQRDMLVNQHLDEVKSAFSVLTNKDRPITVLTKQEAEDYFVNQDNVNQSFTELQEKANLNPNYTLDKFVVGDSNKLAYATAIAVTSAPSITYNPLFIYGGPELGKTHLMQAIGNEMLKNNPNLKVLYVTSENFLNELVTSIKEKNHKSELFRQKYRNIDVFLMDDVQFLSGKEAAQLELYNTFNELYQNKKQILLSADKPPKDIPILEERLKSRFNWGVIVDIAEPDYETRLAILKKKAEDKNIIIDDHILAVIAEKVDSNIRDLEGVLNKVIVLASLTKTPITLGIVEKAINEITLQKENIITPQYIIETVSKYFDVSKKDILSSKKSSAIVFPRQIAMYLCRAELNLPYQKISEEFNKKDHTTVMHAEKKIISEMEENKNTKLIVESVKNILKNSDY